MSENCLHCDEPFQTGDRRTPINEGTAHLHMECMIRMVMGSVGHQLGGENEDDPALTKRQAAQAALKLYRYTALCAQKAVIACPPVDSPLLTRLGLPRFVPGADTQRKLCDRCSQRVWAGPIETAQHTHTSVNWCWTCVALTAHFREAPR